jgi:colicin import membrane protein
MSTKQTPEQIAEAKVVKAAEAKAVKDAKAAEAAAAKAAKNQAAADAKAVKDAEKAAKNNDAEKAAKAAAAAAAEAKALKEAEKAAKTAAAAQAKLDKAAAKEASKMPVANGITRPKAETACGKVWALADAMSAHFKQPIPIKELLEAALKSGLNEATTKTQYARWKAYFGITGQVASLPVAPAA